MAGRVLRPMLELLSSSDAPYDYQTNAADALS